MKKLILVISVMLFLFSGTAFAQSIDVNVVNTDKYPVPVYDVNNPAFQPFQIYRSFSLGAGIYVNSFNFEVPEGKRLVIEYVSADVEIPSGQKFYAYIQTIINVPSGFNTANHNLVPHFTGSFYTPFLRVYKDVFSIGHVVRLYADPISSPIFHSVTFTLNRFSNSGVAEVRASISGYLIDMP